LEITIIGGAREVGKTCLLVEEDGKRFILDCGVKLDSNNGSEYPPLEDFIREGVDAVFLTHAHLDHSGALPLIPKYYEKVPVYGTAPTFSLTELLLEDFIKVNAYVCPFDWIDVMDFMKSRHFVKYRKELNVKGVKVKFLNAGHILGSASIVLDFNGKRIVYTGDINTIETRLLKPADLNWGKVYCVISESTYATILHPDRKMLERKFVEDVERVCESGGKVLVPAFAVCRSQEIMCILAKYNVPYKVYVDGMARYAIEILDRYPRYMRDHDEYAYAVKKATIVGNWRHRRKIIKLDEPCVIIASSGMLKGGVSRFYLEKLYDDPNNAIFLVGYQVENTPGRKLLDTGKIDIEDVEVDVEADVEFYDFSSHTDGKGFEEIFKRNTPEKAIIVHGEEENVKFLAKKLDEDFGIESFAPKNLDVIRC